MVILLTGNGCCMFVLLWTLPMATICKRNCFWPKQCVNVFKDCQCMILTHTYIGMGANVIVLSSLRVCWNGVVALNLYWYICVYVLCRFLIAYGWIVLGQENNVIIIEILLTHVACTDSQVIDTSPVKYRHTSVDRLLCLLTKDMILLKKITGNPQRKIH